MWFLACSPSYTAQQDSVTALQSDELVQVTIEKWISFEPVDTTKDIAVVFYPGGRVEPQAYSPILRKIAEHGYPSYIVMPPMDLAIFDQDMAETIIDSSSISQWVLSGHSLGGVAAAKMTEVLEDEIVGLSLWASYPAGSVDISEKNVAVQSLAGTKDTVLDWDNWLESDSQLPADTSWLEIEGGNHSQFGDYGAQDGDGEASISKEEQWEITSQSVLELLQQVSR